MNKRSYLHLGAHRTGSSSFQQCLFENREILSGLGFDVVYPGRDGVPNGRLRMNTKLPRKRHGEKRMGLAMRKQLCWYSKGIHEASHLKKLAITVSTYQDIEGFCQQLSQLDVQK